MTAVCMGGGFGHGLGVRGPMKGEGYVKMEEGAGVGRIRSLEGSMGQLSPQSPEKTVLIMAACQIPIVLSYPVYGHLLQQLYKMNTALNGTKVLHDLAVTTFLAGENSATELCHLVPFLVLSP